MKGIYPSYAGKTADGKTIMNMVDRAGNIWGTGVSENRILAIKQARQIMPRTTVIRQALGLVAQYPALTSAIAGFFLYGRQWMRGERPSIISIGMYMILAYAACRIIRSVVQDGRR